MTWHGYDLLWGKIYESRNTFKWYINEIIDVAQLHIPCASLHFVPIFPIHNPVSRWSSLSLRCSVFLLTSPCVALCAAVLLILIFRANTALRVVTGCVTFVLPIPSGKRLLRSRRNKHHNIDVHDEWKETFAWPNLSEEESHFGNVVKHNMRGRESGRERSTICPLPSHLGLKDIQRKHSREKLTPQMRGTRWRKSYLSPASKADCHLHWRRWDEFWWDCRWKAWWRNAGVRLRCEVMICRSRDGHKSNKPVEVNICSPADI